MFHQSTNKCDVLWHTTCEKRSWCHTLTRQSFLYIFITFVKQKQMFPIQKKNNATTYKSTKLYSWQKMRLRGTVRCQLGRDEERLQVKSRALLLDYLSTVALRKKNNKQTSRTWAWCVCSRDSSKYQSGHTSMPRDWLVATARFTASSNSSAGNRFALREQIY